MFKRNLSLSSFIGFSANFFVCGFIQAAGNHLEPSDMNSIAKLESRGIVRAYNSTQRNIVINAVRAPLDRLLSIGISSYAGIGLGELSYDFSTVQVYDAVRDMSSVEGRIGSLNFPSDRAIVVQAKEVLGLEPYPLTLLIFHEFLGALGYIDDDYQITVPLFLMAFNPETRSKLQEPQFQDLLQGWFSQKRSHNPRNSFYQQFAGGISGVGGGGDPIGIEIKCFLVFSAIEANWAGMRRLNPSQKNRFLAETLRLRIVVEKGPTRPPDRRLFKLIDEGNERWMLKVHDGEWKSFSGSLVNSQRQLAENLASEFLRALNLGTHQNGF